MNLITDPWIPVVREDGSLDSIAPWQIVEKENPVIEIKAPRPDFQGALYQFLIGLMRTCFAPEDEAEWLEYWQEIPEESDLQEVFAKVQDAFELDNPDGPAFMQDFNFPDGGNKEISTLFIEAPGVNTIKGNLDHFVKRGQINHLCPSCVATALFTLQANAPSGGSGHRVGLRGGGPLTTLLVAGNSESNLWESLWLNILNKEELSSTDLIDGSILPWLCESRLSDKGQITIPGHVHDLQMYWGMPRRIRLGENVGQGICDLCGTVALARYKDYRTKNHGTNYEGAWVHPLTPYTIDPKNKKPPLSLKGQQGGLGYRHWLSLVMHDSANGGRAATIVQFFQEERFSSLGIDETVSLWCFGFDMDNMKARCWYDNHFPVLSLNKKQRANFIGWVGEFTMAARAVVSILRGAVKAAWFKRPKDAKGDMSMIDTEFWHGTEPDFYRLLHKLAALPGEADMAPAEIYQHWFKTMERNMFRIFERATLDSIPEGLDLKRIILAKQTLKKNFYGNKEVKKIKIRANEEIDR
jgi:CRISPR system Cascade subunit CasA